MEYFYAYIVAENDYESIISSVKRVQSKIDDSCIYIDLNSQKEWCDLIQNIKSDDRLYYFDMSSMAADANQLLENLSVLSNQNVEVRLLDNTYLNIEQLMILIDFVKKTQRKQNYEKQMEGIQRALEKKRIGKGAYGRPKIILPIDFEDNIKKIMKKEMKHEDYREKLGFKRSTYFKFVKDLKDSWKQQELDSSQKK